MSASLAAAASAGAKAASPPPLLLETAALHRWFSTDPAAADMIAAGYVGPTLTVSTFTFGQSNPTFLLHDIEGVRFVGIARP